MDVETTFCTTPTLKERQMDVETTSCKTPPFKNVRWTLKLHLVLTSYASKEIEEKRESKRVNFKQTLISVPFFVNSLT